MISRTIVGLLLSATVCLPAISYAQENSQDTDRAEWLRQAKWGVMYHYSQANFGKFDSEEKWDQAISDFDVDGLARQLHQVGAGYFVLTSRHMGLPLAKFSSVQQGAYPRRDLIGDLADALGKYDIQLMLYYPTGMGVDPPRSYETAAVEVRELSLRYGGKVRGWWFDNNTGIEKAQQLITAAAREGNPAAIVAFSPARGVRRNSPYDDYTAGNTHDPTSVRCSGRIVDGAQWHMLTYLGYSWGGIHNRREQPRYSAERVAQITKSITDQGGVVTWDTPFDKETGLVAPACWPHLQAIGNSLNTSAAVVDPNDLP